MRTCCRKQELFCVRGFHEELGTCGACTIHLGAEADLAVRNSDAVRSPAAATAVATRFMGLRLAVRTTKIRALRPAYSQPFIEVER
jgi:hypothetical protein